MKIDRHDIVTLHRHELIGLLSFEPILAWSMCERVITMSLFEQRLKGWKHPPKWGKGHRKYDVQTPSLMCREYLMVVLMSFGAFYTYLPLEKWFPSLDIGFKIFNYHLGVGERSPESPRVKSVGFTFPDGLNCIFQKLGRSQNTTKMLPIPAGSLCNVVSRRGSKSKLDSPTGILGGLLHPKIITCLFHMDTTSWWTLPFSTRAAQVAKKERWAASDGNLIAQSTAPEQQIETNNNRNRQPC